MFGFITKQSRERIEDLERSLASQREMIKSLRKELEELKEPEYNDGATFNFFDPSVTVLSIERIKRDGRWQTVIGYILKDSPKENIREWMFEISDNKHQELVAEFSRIKAVGYKYQG